MNMPSKTIKSFSEGNLNSLNNRGSEALVVLEQARQSWDALRAFRDERKRNISYTYGDQWGDIITDERGVKMREEDYIKQQGSIPLKNNLIRRLVRNVMGVYRGQNKEPTCSANDRDEQKLGETMSIALQCNWNVNKMSELNSRMFEEFLIDGIAITKEIFEWRNDKMDCWTDTPQHDFIFFDGAMRDYRHQDISMIGEIHDVSFEDLCGSFAKNKNDYNKLRDIYNLAANKTYLTNMVDRFDPKRRSDNLDFLVPYDNRLCRVIEVWRKEQKPRYRCHDYLNGDYYKDEIESEKAIIEENNRRITDGESAGMKRDEIPLIEYEWFMDSYWYYRFISPLGDVLAEGETPYSHKSHPYTIKIYPFIGGEIHSFVGDIIDQQRYVNRLITLNDWVIRSSAKGVLMFPEEMMPDNMTVEDLQVEWTRFNGLILYKGKAGIDPPKQIANNSTRVGIFEMLQLQMNLMEDISGITGAMQGKPGYAGMSGTLYAQQQQNASSSLLDILESFSSFVREGALKKIKNIQQFYDTKRVLNIVGKMADGVIEYDPNKISDIEFDLSIIESTSTPAIRSMANEILLDLFKAGQVSIEQLLTVGNFPFADTLLQMIKSQKEQIEQGQVPDGLPEAMKQQISSNVSPKAQAMMSR